MHRSPQGHSTSRPPGRSISRTSARQASARTRWLLVAGLLAIAVPFATATEARAQEQLPDQVTLQLPESSSRITIRCEVLDYTGESIQLVTMNGAPRKTYPASQVVDVRTPQTPEHVRGLTLFAAGRAEDASQAFNQALLDETRTWVRRDILAMLCRCSLWLGHYADAANRFILLAQSDPATRHAGLAPLIWTPASLNGELRSQARIWLSHPVPAARLIGCSILLNDQNLGRTAEAELRRLSISPSPWLQELARAQMWRKRLGPNGPGPEELDGWQTTIEAMPEAVRGGPWFVLGQARLARNELDRAAEALLWLPIVYPHDRQLAARAALQAAESYAGSGQQLAANTVYRELVERFSDTSFAQDARAALEAEEEASSRPSENVPAPPAPAP
ncbi:MAG: hypothetical protein KDA79_14725 [Planctomycetaceae bacterium]|nr:hypothetical protein [Planctomycetaceae bacterium]